MARLLPGAVTLVTLLGIAPLHGEESRSETTRTTHVVTLPDGTTRTTITETTRTTQNGRTTTSTRTTTLAPGQAPPPEPEEAPPPVVSRHKAPPVGPAAMAAILDAHNRERRKVGVPPLAWDPALARLADEWAHHLCRSGRSLPTLQHRAIRRGSPGENLWEGAATEPIPYPIDDAVASWAGERKFFDERTGGCRGGVCGHYTQLVWRNTSHVGCAHATCAAAGMTATIWACNYGPPGNVIGERPY